MTALAGGRFADLIHDGDTVTRLMWPGAPNVHSLLCHLEQKRFPLSPRLLGVTGAGGREVRSLLPGVPRHPPHTAAVRSERAWRSAARAISVGDRFGKWTVAGSRVGGLQPRYLCRCHCRTRQLVQARYLVAGKSGSWGCGNPDPTGKRVESMTEYRVTPGQTFGRWSVLRPQSGAHVWCICACGTERNVRVARLHNGQSRSCGCSRYALDGGPDRKRPDAGERR